VTLSPEKPPGVELMVRFASPRLRWLLAASLLLGSLTGAAAPATAADAELLKDIAPTGKLRVAIAVAPTPSAFWATKDAAGEVRGVTVELGRVMATALDVPATFVVFASSGEIVKAEAANKWDVTFVPVDAARKLDVDFGAPYHVLQSTYLAGPNSVVKDLAEANAAGVRIAGVADTATFRASMASSPQATHMTVANVDAALVLIAEGKADLVALSRESLGGLAGKMPGARVLDGAFLNSTTAVAVPKGRARARLFVTTFIEQAKADGTVRRALDQVGLAKSVVAPAGMAP
jgi:polar amino acid transport system substrate-binding protein